MRSRREFLKTAALGVLGLVLPAGLGLRHLAVTRHGDMYIVNGWVLTAEDVAALRHHDL